MEWMTHVQSWIALGTLTALEIVTPNGVGPQQLKKYHLFSLIY